MIEYFSWNAPAINSVLTANAPIPHATRNSNVANVCTAIEEMVNSRHVFSTLSLQFAVS
jgi:hypothetical protein